MSEEALAKTGPELFKELLRLYDSAEHEDYFKAGAWKNDLMKTDLVLIEAHRKEAGAPDPPNLEDVEMPPLPASTMGVASLLGQKMASLGGALTPAATGTLGGGPVAELRLIALFIAKWKLDPTRAKILLAKLNPQKRRYVIQNFKATASGEAAMTELEAYLTECEQNGQWDKGGIVLPVSTGATILGKPASSLFASRPATIVPANALMTSVGVKRPIVPSALTPAASRPRLAISVPSPGQPQTATSALAARLALARANTPKAGGLTRPASAGLIRPLGLIRR
jgi:hypothetical protein